MSQAPTIQGKSDLQILYCNGIEATEDQAKEQAALISKAFGGRLVTIVYNPTKLDGYLRFDRQQEEKQLSLGAKLATAIRNKLIPQVLPEGSLRTYTVLLFAHSHGTSITKIALSKLTSSERQNVVVNTFGGVTMIPKSLAKEVTNYIFEEDMIARTGSRGYDREGVLDRIMQIKIRMRQENSTLRQAIIRQYTEDTYLNLDPIMTALSEADPFTRADKSRRFGQGFLGGNAEVFGEAAVKEGLQKYISYFEEYHVEVLSRPLKQGNSPEEILDIDSMCKEAVTTMCSYGGYSLSSHILPAFEGVIQKIADRFPKEAEKRVHEATLV